LAASGSTAPVIFMTAFDDEATRQEAVAASFARGTRTPHGIIASWMY
jgi:hypothetical protein